VSDRDAFRANRAVAKAKLHEKRLENATYIAAEVKVLTETASKVAYELGRREAQGEIVAMLEDRAAGWTLRDSATGEVLLGMAKTIRSMASQPPGAASDAISGVPGHSEVSEAPKAPQEPCGHPDCLCHRPEEAR
jgi:hypothetical protein